MGARSRSIIPPAVGGSYVTLPSTTVVQSPVIRDGAEIRTDDVVGNRSGFNAFKTSTTTRAGGIANGYRLNGSLTAADRNIYDWHIDAAIQNVPDPSIGPLGNSLTLSLQQKYAWQILKRTNPGRPEVNLPQFLGELKDIPDMMRGWARLLRQVHLGGSKISSAIANMGEIQAAGLLTYRWGIAPFLSDVTGMIGLQEKVDKRFLDLNRLHSGQKQRTRTKLGTGSMKVKSANQTFESGAFFMQGYWEDVYTYKVWGTCQWYAPEWSIYRKMDPPALLARAKSEILGLTAMGAVEAAYELLPWSWLVDWFTDAGTIISANLNSLDLLHSGMCIMQTSQIKRKATYLPMAARYANIEIKPMTRTRTVKERRIVTTLIPVPMLRWPILTGRQVSIVGALSVVKASPTIRRLLRSLGRKSD